MADTKCSKIAWSTLKLIEDRFSFWLLSSILIDGSWCGSDDSSGRSILTVPEWCFAMWWNILDLRLVYPYGHVYVMCFSFSTRYPSSKERFSATHLDPYLYKCLLEIFFRQKRHILGFIPFVFCLYFSTASIKYITLIFLEWLRMT
jgi:hypothetical protein